VERANFSLHGPLLSAMVAQGCVCIRPTTGHQHPVHRLPQSDSNISAVSSSSTAAWQISGFRASGSAHEEARFLPLNALGFKLAEIVN
jgi:hypothetical protein